MAPKLRNFTHQTEILQNTSEEPYFALFLEMGTGKTRIILQNLTYLFQTGKVLRALVIAPNGVHTNWATEEIPKHLDCPHEVYVWNSKRKPPVIPDDSSVLQILTVNVEGFSGKKSRLMSYVQEFNADFITVDESSRIKNHLSQRTKNVIKLGKGTRYKRILTGTPISQGALDIYAQAKFLDQNLLGYASYDDFKKDYCVQFNPALRRDLAKFLPTDLVNRVYKGRCKCYSPHEIANVIPQARQRNVFSLLLRTPMFHGSFINLDKLSNLIKPWSVHLSKDECLDLPDKVYETMFYDMGPLEFKAYKELHDDFITEIRDEEVTAIHILPRLLRIQQILGGFYDNLPIEKTPSRIKTLLEVIEDIPKDRKVIIWSRFVAEIRYIANVLPGKSVVYYGDVKPEDRSKAVKSFQEDDDVRFFVGNQSTAGLGLTLTAATYVIYYSNDFSLENRLQSEDRAHRIGQTNKVTYIDLVCKDTIDETIKKSIEGKLDIANQLINSNL